MMSDDEKPKLVTHEGKSGVTTAADEAVFEAARTGQGLVAVTADQLEQLAKAAAETSDYFLGWAKKNVTKERAEFVRKLRCDEGYTWRAVAQECFDEWEGDWSPPSNQLMGMALCEVSAGFFDENYMSEPWN